MLDSSKRIIIFLSAPLFTLILFMEAQHGSIPIFICSRVQGENGMKSHAVFKYSSKLIKYRVQLTPHSPQSNIFHFIFGSCMYNILYCFWHHSVGDINILLYAWLISISICSQRAHIPLWTRLTHLNSRVFDS